MRILIIEDEETLREAIRGALEDFDFEVTEASDGAAGLELLKGDGSFDVVLTDVFMPEQDGIEVLRAIQRFRETKKFRIFVMSGGGRYGMDMLPLAPGLGAEKIFRKPFEISELVDAIREGDS